MSVIALLSLGDLERSTRVARNPTIHHSADEIVQAIQLIRLWQEADRQDPLNKLQFNELNWEYDIPDWDPLKGYELIPEPVG